MEKMASYGDRVQFSLLSGPLPSYQVMNALGKTMAFDRNHHLLHPQGEEFVGVNATQVYSLDQVKAAIDGIAAASAKGGRTVRVAKAGSPGAGGGKTAAQRLNEQLAAQRYEYFRNNRQSLPPTISEHSDEITDLMKTGRPVEEAFAEVLRKYY